MDPTSAPDRSPLPPAAIAAGLAAAALALYARTGGHPFILSDDPSYVAEHPTVLAGLSWSSVTWAFTTLHYSNWHPLTWLSYLLDASLFDAAPRAMHLVNAALHAANSALVFAALHRLTGARWRSAMVAALFALHPTRVESVAWISERKDLLFTLFGLLALVAYEAYARRPSTRRYLWVVLAFAASLMSKAMLVTLPFLLLLLDVWPLGRIRSPLVLRLHPLMLSVGSAVRTHRGPESKHARDDRKEEDPDRFPPVSWRRAILEKLPLLFLSAGTSALTVAAQAGYQAIIPLPLAERLANVVVGYVRYIGLLVWPVDLAVFYPMPAGGHPGWQVAGAALLLLAVSAAAFLLRRHAPWFALGWCWFLGTLVPVIGFLQVGWQAIADRYSYFPAIGLFLAVTWGADALARGAARRALAPVAAVALVVLAGLSFAQVGVWRDELTLFRHAVAVTGPNGRGNELLALALLRAGRPGEAIGHAREGVRLSPRDERAWMILGLSARDAGELAEAEAALRTSVGLHPGFRDSWAHLGVLLRDTGRPEEAVAAFRAYLGLAPGDLDTWTQVGVLLAGLGRLDEARSALETATATAPDDPRPWRNLATFHFQQQAWPQAAAALTRAAGLAPGDPNVLRQLGFAQLQARDAQAALATADRLAPLDPRGAAELRRMLGAF